MRDLFDGAIWPLGRKLDPKPERASERRTPDWVQANPRFIERATEHAMARSGGGWVAIAASRAVTGTPRRRRILDADWVVYRQPSGAVVVAPNACPHMGAALHTAKVVDGRLVCPWHGLSLGAECRGSYTPKPTHDDGALVWAQMLSDETLGDPPAFDRPSRAVAAVIEEEARCEPRDVVSNRLDPWHGPHYHPHSFARLDVLDATLERLLVRVAFRVVGPLCVEVDCIFFAPTPRSVVMKIVEGEGAGSVVETHATPIAPGRTGILELTLATSDRPGFAIARRLQPIVKAFIRRRASRLWAEDAVYAERRYALRQGAKT